MLKAVITEWAEFYIMGRRLAAMLTFSHVVIWGRHKPITSRSCGRLITGVVICRLTAGLIRISKISNTCRVSASWTSGGLAGCSHGSTLRMAIWHVKSGIGGCLVYGEKRLRLFS